MRAGVWIAMVALTASAATAAPKHGEGAVAQLVEIAQSEKAPELERARAVRELANTELRSHLSVLRRLLREERSLDIRLASACTLAALGDRKSPKDLLLATAYGGERTPSCSRSDVLLALGRIGDPAAEMHLERALRSEAPADEPFFYQDACKALLGLGTPGSRKLMLEALRDGSGPVRHAVVSPLAAWATDASQPERAAPREALLRAARFDPEEKVAEQAASALLWSGVDGPAFFRLLEADPDAKVRARAARVMNRHYLSPQRLQRLRRAIARERDPSVLTAIQETLRGQAGATSPAAPTPMDR